ncbi:MAG: hypothetical protein CSB33_03225 [Desulfobacterales bacterium]|nr:MAG: hypothetical protein CSB33_03225 [Desulfobacterales bacterium]
MNDSEITFELKGWPGGIVFVVLVTLAFTANHFWFRYNPRLGELIQALQSNDPLIIGEALYESHKLTMGKGHKLIPHILPLLSDDRNLSENLKQNIIVEIQSIPGSIPGMESGMKSSYSIGFIAALTLQGLVIKDVENRRRIGGKYQAQIVEYVLDEIGTDSNEFTLKNGLWAVNQIHDKRLVPFWFQLLKIDSESIRAASLYGLSNYIYDRTHGLFTWHPEKEIDANMIENLKLCLVDNSGLVRISASGVVDALAEAGLNTIE